MYPFFCVNSAKSDKCAKSVKSTKTCKNAKKCIMSLYVESQNYSKSANSMKMNMDWIFLARLLCNKYILWSKRYRVERGNKFVNVYRLIGIKKKYKKLNDESKIKENYNCGEDFVVLSVLVDLTLLAHLSLLVELTQKKGYMLPKIVIIFVP